MHEYVLEHIVSLYYRTVEWMFTKLGRDEVLMVPYKCFYFSARSVQGRIQGGAKIGHAGSPSTNFFFRPEGYSNKSNALQWSWNMWNQVLLSPRNALRWGYSNAAVVPCVRASVRASVRGPCACFFVKLGRHVNHDDRMNPIDFGGQRSKVKFTMDIYGNQLVNTIETKPLCISLSNLADMLTTVRGWTLLILEVRGQRSRSQWTYIEISLWTR